MLCTLKISKWGASKQAKDEKNEIAANKSANPEAISVSKKLVSKEALAEVTAAESDIRTIWRENTLPWLADGTRILPAAKFAEISQAMARKRQEWETRVDEFCQNYSHAVSEAKSSMQLGHMFRYEDYPASTEIRRKYSIEIVFAPIPDANDWRVELSQEQTDALSAQLKSQMQAQHRECILEVAGRLKDCVASIAEKLPAFDPAKKGADRGTFRDSLIQNLKDTLGILPALNMFDDPALAGFISKAQALTLHEPEALRTDADARTETAAAAAGMLAELETFMTGGSF
jgi:hypothetical protein